jgi:pimeloyl-ACP methyl ester carboxylesterase
MGNSLESWQPVAKKLSGSARVIAIDMLGFGKSPKPLWATYDVGIQATAIARTVLKLKLKNRPIIVGHSMGALVAIEIAKRFSPLVKRIILCSPPLYENSNVKDWKGKESLLKQLYILLSRHPEKLKTIATIAVKIGIAGKSFNLDGDISKVYAAALQSSIIKQTSVKDLLNLNLPVSILYGQLDPLLVVSTIKRISKQKTDIDCRAILAGHEIQGLYIEYIAKYINSLIEIK